MKNEKSHLRKIQKDGKKIMFDLEKENEIEKKAAALFKDLKSYRNVKNLKGKSLDEIENDYVNNFDSALMESVENGTFQVYITMNHKDKMEGIQSISTSCFKNSFCEFNRTIKGAICQHCFSVNNQKYHINIYAGLRINEILKKVVLNAAMLPTILNQKYFRFEAFGDLENAIQLENYLNIARKNPETNFSLWTKNYKLIMTYFGNDAHRKPSNFRIIISSLLTNKPINLKPFHDLGIECSSFTVYDKEYAAAHNININCGGRKCITCLNCYKKHTKNRSVINELLK